jgi:RNA polymerase primary sigma factor
LNLPFDEDSNYFHPEEVPEQEEQAAPQEESIYTDDPVRVYLREMGAVPLLTRKGELSMPSKSRKGSRRSMLLLTWVTMPKRARRPLSAGERR